MSTPTDPHRPTPGDAFNPYSAPAAPIDGPPAADPGDEASAAEAFRRRYLNHEANVRSIGYLHYLGSFFLALGVVGVGAVLVSGSGRAEANRVLLTTVGAFYLVAAGANAALGAGLVRLQPWARWVDAALVGLSTLANVAAGVVASAYRGGVAPQLVGAGFSGAIGGYILYLLLSAKGAVVFSPAYGEVIARTPHVKYRTGCVAKLALLLLLGFLGAMVVSALLLGNRL